MTATLKLRMKQMDLRGRKFFVTGGAGFIGSRLILQLFKQLEDDCEIVVFDTLSRDSLSGSGAADRSNLKVIKGDVQDAAAMTEAMRGCSVVVHLAGIAGIDTVIANPAHTMHVNMTGCANALEAAHQVGSVERFVNFSTSEVFGNFTYKDSESSWTSSGVLGEARWSYAVSKLAAEHLTYAYYHQYKLPTVTVRPFNIYGPGQVGEGAVHVFVTKALKGETMEIHGDGNQIRSWTYIDDMIDGLMLTLSKPEAVGHVFNIGNPQGALTIYFLAQMIHEIAESNSEIKQVPQKFTDVELRVPNIDKARDLLGFEPKVGLRDGLKRTIDWYREKLSM